MYLLRGPAEQFSDVVIQGPVYCVTGDGLAHVMVVIRLGGHGVYSTLHLRETRDGFEVSVEDTPERYLYVDGGPVPNRELFDAITYRLADTLADPLGSAFGESADRTGIESAQRSP